MKSITTTLVAIGIVALLSTVVVPIHASAAPASSLTVTATGSLGDTSLTFEIPSIPMQTIMAGDRSCVQFILPHEGKMLQAGSPELPLISRSIVIPDTARMTARVVNVEYTDYTGLCVAPSKGNLQRTVNPDDVPYTFGDVYTANAWFPSEIVSLSDPYILRDFRGVAVHLCPIQYNPVLGIVRVYTQVTVEVSSAGTDTQNILTRASWPQTISSQYALIYARHFVNLNTLRYTPVEEQGNMLIITYDSFYQDMVPFLQWKNQKGIPTEMVNVSTIGNAQAIKTYISDYYTAHGLTFVLLVGDSGQIPVYLLGGDASDPSYSYIVGNDHYPDLFVGRFSAENDAQVLTQVERSIEYERDAQSSADWYHKGSGIGSPYGVGDDGEYDWQHIRNIRADLLNFTYTDVDEFYGGSQGGEDQPGDPTQAMVASALNEGRSILNYCGHGSYDSWDTSGFSISNVNQLTNDNMLPFIDSVACFVGDFNGMTCFCEAWLRATHNGEPTGAIAHFGSVISQSWSPPMAAEDETIDLLTHQYPDNYKCTIGGIYFDGCMKMNDDYGQDGYDMTDYWTIFGDPSLQVRTASPAVMDVQASPGIPIGSDYFDVTVTGVEGALCSVSRLGVLIGSGYTDANGYVHIQFNAPLYDVDDVKLTVTAFNKVTYTSDIIVFAGSPPATPSTPQGPASGNVDVAYSFTTSTTDPDNDNVSFRFDWGDGNISDWGTPVPSGATASMNHTWKDGGTYNVTCQARDIYHLKTNWSAATTIHIMKPILSVQKIASGLMGFSITVANDGDGDASMIPWTVDTKRVYDYPQLFLNHHFAGNISEIVAGKTAKVTLSPIMGIGNIKITIHVYTMERHCEAVVIGPVVIIIPG